MAKLHYLDIIGCIHLFFKELGMMSLGMPTEYQQNWELSRETLFLMRAMKVSLYPL
jgi:hypothetical protein